MAGRRSVRLGRVEYTGGSEGLLRIQAFQAHSGLLAFQALRFSAGTGGSWNERRNGGRLSTRTCIHKGNTCRNHSHHTILYLILWQTKFSYL